MYVQNYCQEYFKVYNSLIINNGFCYYVQTVTFNEGAVTSIIEMAISYNYEYLAMFTDTGLLWIGSADLQVWFVYTCKS